MTAFEFATAQRIKFGPGSVRQLAGLTRGFGERVGLITGGSSLAASGRLAEIEAQLRETGIDWKHVSIASEPAVESVDRIVSELSNFSPEVAIGIGGGSVLDTAKAVAALLTNGGSALDYLEGVGRGATLSKPSLPCIAVPTTAGTGSEATRNAVIGDEARTFKKSMRSATMLPALALVDPELTRSCPREISAACGMDALTQLIEAYVSPRASPLTDSLALQGIGMAAELPFLLANTDDDSAREAMSLASLLGGICLANAGLGAVHGLAAPMGAKFPIPHGVLCACLLAPVLRTNISRALEQDQPGLILKYSAVYEILVGTSSEEDESDIMEPRELQSELELAGSESANAMEWPGPEDQDYDTEQLSEEATDEEIEMALAADNAMELVRYLGDLKESLRIPGLAEMGLGPEHFAEIIAASGGTSMHTNPVKLSPDDLRQILEAAL